jgi:hypothetical protein
MLHERRSTLAAAVAMRDPSSPWQTEPKVNETSPVD